MTTDDPGMTGAGRSAPQERPRGGWRGDAEHTGPVSVSGRTGWTPDGVDPASVTAPHPVRRAWTSAPQAPARQPERGRWGAPAASRPQPPGGRFGPRPPAPPPERPRRGDRAEAVAFRLHQFPIGYLPVAAAHASRQLPVPAPADGSGFPPRDHPRTELVDDREALARARSGEFVAAPEAEGLPKPEDFAEGHGPGGHREPAEEAVPAPAEPIVLEPEAVLDLLGSGEERIAAPEGTAFTCRGLPPEHLELPYRRYRVLRPLPVWRSTAAPRFGERGGGTRYRLTHPAAELVALGHLVELTADRLAAEAGTLRLDRQVIEAADRAGGQVEPERPTRPMSERAPRRGPEVTEEIVQ
ncbi:TNT domain-containing protein [Saccharopolyspora sp. MS10]|uniref:TNT domain-containing protein n=1 Tax=Saccharopolyspora sp. MS10 TaxID=3385973 RepID=UPI0039A3649A